MAKKILTPVVRLHPEQLYSAVFYSPSQGNTFCNVPFGNSISKRPVLMAEINKLRGKGCLVHAYPWHPDIAVEWPDGIDKPHQVYIEYEESPIVESKRVPVPKKRK